MYALPNYGMMCSMSIATVQITLVPQLAYCDSELGFVQRYAYTCISSTCTYIHAYVSVCVCAIHIEGIHQNH